MALLLAASVLFYLGGGNLYRQLGGVLVLLGGSLVTLCAVSRMTVLPEKKGTALTLAAAFHVGLLAFYKYLAPPLGALSGGAASLLHAPLGLSFFTFQQLWYLKRVYTGEAQPLSRGQSLLFALFFPTVTSGPILRADDFARQMAGPHFLRPDGDDLAAGLYALCLGMGKKTLLADPLGLVVANGWASADTLTAPAAWLTVLAYTLQLYLDFSGYCDIASGAARLLGVRLPVNFSSPYRALSVGEFWKRWHITLTDFLRECVYIPLGGSHHGTCRTDVNILIVFLISGIWHGTGWTFLLWGALHALAQIVERHTDLFRLPKALRWALTFAFVNVAWIFFRAPTLSAAWGLLRSALLRGGTTGLDALSAGLFSGELTAAQTLLPALAHRLPLLALAALFAAALTVVFQRRTVLAQMDTFRPTAAGVALCATVLVWSVLSFSGISVFIYSNF